MSPSRCLLHGGFIETCESCAREARLLGYVTKPESGELTGDKDISVPVHEIEPYVGSDWLRAGQFPRHLRPGGWVYLRSGGHLMARVRVVGMEWRKERPYRTGDTSPPGEPGWVFRVDSESWERVDISLGELAKRQRQGYRYLIADRAGNVRHLLASDRVPEGDWDE